MASKHGKKSSIFVKHEVLEPNCILNKEKSASIYTCSSTKVYGITDKINFLLGNSTENNGINHFFLCRGRWKMQQILTFWDLVAQCIFLSKRNNPGKNPSKQHHATQRKKQEFKYFRDFFLAYC